MSDQHKQQKSTVMKWQSHIKALPDSGLSRAEYCRQHNLPYHALAYWQRKLQPIMQAPVLVQVSTTRPVLGNLPDKPEASGVSIRLNNTIAIELAEQFSPDTLNKVLAILEGR